MKKAFIIALSLALSQPLFAQTFSAKEKECLAKITALESIVNRANKIESRLITEVYINQTKTKGYPNSFCDILFERQQKKWNRKVYAKIALNWPVGYKKYINQANRMISSYEKGQFDPISHGATDYSAIGEIPRSNRIGTIMTDHMEFYSPDIEIPLQFLKNH